MVARRPRPGDRARYFGPYLGGQKTRDAVSGLGRVLPLGHTADRAAGTECELARARGASPGVRADLARAVTAVLDRDPTAVTALRAGLIRRRLTHIIPVMTDTDVIDEVPPAVTDSFAVQVRDLRMSYGSTEVLRGVDFDVRYGEVFCLLGPNGAGKTTTLEILEGFRPPTGGVVRVLGLNPAAQSARLRERTGMVLQECGFPRQARVAELIDIWRSYYPDPRPLGELLDVVELTEMRSTQVRKLSAGQRRRLDFALALAGDPDLVFLDEPTTGFDPEARRRCWAAIENLRRLGTTILLTTHYLDEAERLADRIAIVRAGRIELAGTTQEVAARAGLATRISFTTPSALRQGQVALPEEIDLTVRGPVSVCHTDNAAVTLRRLLDWAVANRLGDLDGLAVTAPSLEDTYLQLTGADGDLS
jgi:ABC-2 type transport system ATP-binding protein